ncbi:MAG: sulfurtransferase [Acidimicrobiia bacterium]|nr:sulfurtransferase [Acidimicrobiia bacterium]
MTCTLPGPVVDAAWLVANRHEPDLVVIDSRWYLDGRSGLDAYVAGHIPGAVRVDLDRDLSAPAGAHGRHPLPTPDGFAAAMGRSGVGNDSTVVVYDDAGGVVAGRLWWMLDSVGGSVAVLDGGIDAWSGELETGQGDPPRVVDFDPRPWPDERFATADDVLSLHDRPGAVVLDARSSERFRGDENPVDRRFGHIPGARNAPSVANLHEGRLRSPDDLRARYGEIGVGSETAVVAYCGSGVSACLDLLSLRRAGLADGRLYVGSWSEWGADPSRPVETGDDPL